MILLNTFGINRTTALELAKETSVCMLGFKRDFIDKYGVNLSNKLISELVGKIFEVQCERVLTKRLGYEVRKEKRDKEPDLFFTRINKPLEVKLTSTTSAWTGGEFSKRPFDYLLVSWGGNFDEFFMALVHLEKKNWKSNFESNFYGPSYSAAKLYERKDKIVLLGSFEKTPRGTVKIVREKI
ncbi:hypothetical protein COT30_03350 [Candidatus Micrarchaeota archaeon CG08_land_8_20_14_0_20_49_17]|nr:MAG: hypothetical protein COT30_03350 [Candidatus Micrarchaeota archaeon CG08_land_8_20_14_0_20_49_17]PIU82584.1 MAG: hypothetical protein COS70_00535 [Candidatus Micrarchaeota archaeon CG06_land_8_20_14_3_00_50_6]PIZ98319.1 MAG: hypothetical protein COX84_02110 [Candidatus Micrarchaeota archaeon CG_4_10_14_0_2_um_filter_49_7]HII53693.1 hypothetical protein [Candidatus Micrarchaeota archaeon]